MGYKIAFWNGIHRAKKWRDENPEAAARLDVEAVERDKQRRIPRVEVPPEKKEENKEGTDEEHTHMEGEVTSELDGPTDTTATEAVNESGAAKAKVVGRADDNRGDRRGTETENGRDSDVADNEPRHTTEAMHRKEGPNIKLNNNKRPRCTDKKENNQRSQPTEGVQNNNIDTDTERSIKQNEKESENRQREQPLWRQGASGRHVWDTVRHYNNMIQAEPNDALQALTAQIPDRGWRLAARKRSGADGEIGKNSDTSNTMTRGEHQSGSRNKTV